MQVLRGVLLLGLPFLWNTVLFPIAWWLTGVSVALVLVGIAGLIFGASDQERLLWAAPPLIAAVTWATFAPLIVGAATSFFVLDADRQSPSEIIRFGPDNLRMVVLTDHLREEVSRGLGWFLPARPNTLVVSRANKGRSIVEFPVLSAVVERKMDLLPGYHSEEFGIPLLHTDVLFDVLLGTNKAGEHPPQLAFELHATFDDLVGGQWVVGPGSRPWNTVIIERDEPAIAHLEYAALLSSALDDFSLARTPSGLAQLAFATQIAPNSLEEVRALLVMAKVIGWPGRATISDLQSLALLQKAFQILSSAPDVGGREPDLLQLWLFETVARGYADAGDFSDRIASLETRIPSIKERLTQLPNKRGPWRLLGVEESQRLLENFEQSIRGHGESDYLRDADRWAWLSDDAFASLWGGARGQPQESNTGCLRSTRSRRRRLVAPVGRFLQYLPRKIPAQLSDPL